VKTAPSGENGVKGLAALPVVQATTRALRGLSPEGRDALLYAASALFAGVTGLAVGISLYRQWGQLAVGPYALAAVIMAVAAWRRGKAGPGQGQAGRPGDRARRTARIIAFLIVLFGATLVPLTLEVIWRTEGNPAQHVQPEVIVVEQAGARAAHGKDPYRVIDRDGHVVIHAHDEPTYELYYPYLPGMILFGFSSGFGKVEPQLTDARIQFLVFSVLVTLLALSRLRPPTDARVRAFQVLTVLPTAALPFATGGDDMPVAALMLLGLAALQRRRPVLAGLALGAASSLKFTAWPLLVLALWAARDLRLHRAVGRYLVGAAAVVVPVVMPLALAHPTAFVDNVIRFPLGLAGVSSPAASALPGHILVSIFPGAHKPYVVVVGVVGVAILVRYLWRKPPDSAAQVATVTGWVMLIAILLAPATRVGYLLYPINLFVWAWLLRRAEDPAQLQADGEPDGSADGVVVNGIRSGPQVSSGISNSSTEYGVNPVEVVGETTTPTSQ
jgi:MYXO-CTERM domain-containing protein